MPLGLSTFHITTNVFLILERLKFPAQDSTIKISQKCCVMILLRKFRNLRNLILNTEKLYWVWSSYSHARKKKLISKSLQFKVANKWLESSEAYLSYQRCLLNKEISIK